MEGFLCNDLRKVLHGCQRMGKVDNDEETLSKISSGRAVSNEFGHLTYLKTFGG